MSKKNKTDIKKAFKYYCMGLDSKEIATLLGCSYRTIQNYMSYEDWKQERERIRAKELRKLKESILEEIRLKKTTDQEKEG